MAADFNLYPPVITSFGVFKGGPAGFINSTEAVQLIYDMVPCPTPVRVDYPLDFTSRSSTRFDQLFCPRCGSRRVERYARACIYPSDPCLCGECRHSFTAEELPGLWE